MEYDEQTCTKLRESTKTRLLNIAASFEEDGTDRAWRMACAVEDIDAKGGLSNPDLALAICYLVWQVMEGLNPRRIASEKAARASSCAKAGLYLLQDFAKEQAKINAKSTRAATVRAILPALIERRDRLRAVGYSVPNLNGERSARTIADWIKN